tara:strand:+ start:934 stop:1560 length:627 start_codon:yes stop_codon:yes gene_type:complete
MSRYRKSIHKTLEEVSSWQPPKEPEPIVEEAPIPTETGRELLKKRIAHQKVEKKEMASYISGDAWRNKLSTATQHLKEALDIEEVVKWEVKVSGLPTFYADGKSKGDVRKTLRKMLKRPDDIQSISRTTPAELKKIRRAQIAGDDEDEDKNPVGKNYNESTEWETMWKAAAKSKPKMSYKDAEQFTKDVGLSSSEKKSAMKAAKKWLK